MATITYKLKFYSDWHCGSGLAAGADVDALTVKDSDRFPFVPGKTIKGLLREQMFYVLETDVYSHIRTAFGDFDGKDDKCIGCVFFSNAEISPKERSIIKQHNAQEFLFRSISSTAIDESGIAVDSSLRRIEVAIPCTLEGRITGVPDDMIKQFTNGLKMIKRLGQNRSRGLGRCEFHEIF